MYYRVNVGIERLYFDYLEFIRDDDFYIMYVFNSFKSTEIKRGELLSISPRGSIEMIVKTSNPIEESAVSEMVRKTLSTLQGRKKKNDILRNHESIRQISMKPIKKSEAAYVIKENHYNRLRRLESDLRHPHLRYYRLIRSMLKRLGPDHLLKVLPTFSIVMKKDNMSDYFKKALFYLFVKNYFTKHRLIFKHNLNRFDAEIMIFKNYDVGKILIIDKENDFFDRHKVKDLFKVNNRHAYILETDDVKDIENEDFHFRISQKKDAVTQVLEKHVIDETMKELNQMIGLNKMKETVKRILVHQYVNQIHHDSGESISNHFAFMGGPGTGKTTVARLLSSYFYKLGLLSKGHTVEVDRGQLVGGYVGQTALKTSNILKKSQGGVLFIDEAYSLYGEGRDYGIEAINTITKHMEDHRHDFVTIFAGYKKPMEKMMTMNEGLKGRINHHIIFDAYSSHEMCLIFESMCDKEGFKYEESLVENLHDYFETLEDTMKNGRHVRQIFESVKETYAYRIYETNDTKSIKNLKVKDFIKPYHEKAHDKVIGFRRSV
ncbi:AAA family ATPase [Acidaminobacter sp. JC074]|uniref:AAA family ATPase n=1 Tax=Acidaminobacter sp. JC074 TaxID=2530199 RepID=UPI001F0EA3B3|nr:AAA family ATPase [Acidaminobacter sp. JC074]MCH4887868.1 AAA family ATPase [Acidaminobacter sp. JC074]